ncbi:transposase [Phaeobacter sp. B1627]|nr:transposase [Phaeobacter sp. B1627]
MYRFKGEGLYRGRSYIEPGSPWENGVCESFSARFHDELLNGEIVDSSEESQRLFDNGTSISKQSRRTAQLGDRPTALKTIIPKYRRSTMHSQSNQSTRWAQTMRGQVNAVSCGAS